MALKRKTLRDLIFLGLFIILVSGGVLFTLQYFRGDKIKDILVSELNKHLLTKTTVSKLDINLFRSFPNASLIMTDVNLQPPPTMPQAPAFIKAEKIILKFNIWNIITGRYNIQAINIDNAILTFYENRTGENNYTVFKAVRNTSNKSVELDIRHLILQSSQINYIDETGPDRIKLSVNKAVLKGKLLEDHFTLRLNSEFFNDQLLIGGEVILPPGKAEFESVVDIDTQKKLYRFSESNLLFSDVKATFNGMYNYGPDSRIDFLVTSLNGSLPALIKIIPSWVADIFNPYKPQGELEVKGSIKGPVNDPEMWVISCNGEVKKGDLFVSNLNRNISDVNATGSLYYGGKVNSEVLKLHEFSGKLGSGKLKGQIMVANFSQPHGNVTININSDIKEFKDLTDKEGINNADGQLIADLKYQGSFTDTDRLDERMTGEASFIDAGFQYQNEKINAMNGTLAFRQKKLYFDGLSCRIGQTDLKANGYIENLVSYIANSRQNVHASLSLYSDELVLEDIIGLVSKNTTSSVSTSIFPPHITFDALLSVGRMNYKKLSTQNITGQFSLKEDILRGKDIKISAFGGSIYANGIINGKYGNRAQIVTKADFKSVDINQLFYQFDNFGQTALVSYNLKGTADAKVEFATSLFSDFSVNTNTIEAVADIEIRQGELNDFEPLQALSNFLDTKELRNVKFATLNNKIEIRQKTVLIPNMEIRSSALNLVGYGTHTFGNDIDYHINMLLADVLRAKRKNHDEVEKYVEEDEAGKPRLFLSLTGPIEDPVVKYDTKAVGKKITNDLRHEKKVFRDAMKKEFGKKDQQGTKDPVKQSPEFQIEWDEIK